jgi:hypothetical protein
LLLLTVQISVHVHAARFGVVWNSFPGFAWLLLRCLWNIVRKKSTEIEWTLMRNKIQQQKHAPFEVPWLKANASHYKMQLEKSIICTIWQDLFSNEKNLNFLSPLLRHAGFVTSLGSR